MPVDVDRVIKLIGEKREWMGKAISTLESTPKTINPNILVCQFFSERDAFEGVAKPILNKQKPKIDPPPARETKNTKPDEDQPEVSETSNMETDNKPNAEETNMDLD